MCVLGLILPSSPYNTFSDKQIFFRGLQILFCNLLYPFLHKISLCALQMNLLQSLMFKISVSNSVVMLQEPCGNSSEQTVTVLQRIEYNYTIVHLAADSIYQSLCPPPKLELSFEHRKMYDCVVLLCKYAWIDTKFHQKCQTFFLIQDPDSPLNTFAPCLIRLHLIHLLREAIP